MSLSGFHSPSHHHDIRGDGEDTITGRTILPSPVINAALDTVDLRRDVVRDSEEKVHSQCMSLSLYTLRWKELEDHFASLRLSFHQLRMELENKLQLTEWRAKRLNTKEKQLKTKEQQLAEKCREIDATYQLISQCYLTVLEKKNECLLGLEKAQSIGNGLKLNLKSVAEKERALKVQAEEMEKQSKELDKTEESGCRKMFLCNPDMKLEERGKKLNAIERGLLEKSLDLESQQKKFDERWRELEKREMELRKRKRLWKNQLQSGERALHDKLQNLESKQKKFVQEYKAFKEKEKCVDNMLVQFKDEQVAPSDVDIRFYITMNGMELHRYLHRRVDHLDSMHEEVKRALLLSANPAKLVLEAVCGFYYLPNSGNRDEVLGLEVVSIFLLEQLAALNLKNISEEEKERARLLAIDWQSKIGMNNHPREHCLKILGFWQLVGTYRIVNKFDEDELLKLLEMASQYRASRVLCESLGLMDKIQASSDDGVVDNPVEIPKELDDVCVINTNYETDNSSPVEPTVIETEKMLLKRTMRQTNQQSQSSPNTTPAKKRPNKGICFNYRKPGQTENDCHEPKVSPPSLSADPCD